MLLTVICTLALAGPGIRPGASPVQTVKFLLTDAEVEDLAEDWDLPKAQVKDVACQHLADLLDSERD